MFFSSLKIKILSSYEREKTAAAKNKQQQTNKFFLLNFQFGCSVSVSELLY